ncbi:MgtC/SapB family protein [Terrabacter sp. NPDC000476]|uniref:MgtC/SapB family protein n=1 Tax=Terrabacter sp. NPDC000476 TaxID=3154258 RepID=UPI003321F4E2
MPAALPTALVSADDLTQIGDLPLAFALSTVIGFERQLRGESAGPRTQTFVGQASASSAPSSSSRNGARSAA